VRASHGEDGAGVAGATDDHLWSRRFGDPFIQEGEIAVDPSGAIACAGDFYFGIQFDGTTGGELSDPERDMFVALFNP
jgi:hypothetical protein